ncbi:MAG: peptidylprolyl isomerase [Limimaricola sp.]|uniref:peptidylprolyl isomerase n=1 Tax=Limimaricola sp. TaxID=2211665 RepID=UPI001DF3109B|nr:peptidylprolyl isomerase [Limimaricola sp.]MBI1418291.1 peptidylprolyl isomerase [Limimaricola sp.]
MRLILRLVFLMMTLAMPGLAAAQGMFSPVITVNNSAVTGYEIDQRVKLLKAFRTPGDLEKIARQQLVEERLKKQEMDRVGLRMTPDGLTRALNDFAQRGNVTLDQLYAQLQTAGVDRQALRDFVSIGASWRDYVGSRFRNRVVVTETDIDRAIAQMGSSPTALQVLMNEIIIAAPADNPDMANRAMAAAEQISKMTTTAEFEAAARQVSALPSRDQGGRMDWVPVSNYPAPIQAILLGLKPGEVTPPLNITNGVALFQMRAKREVAQTMAAPASIDYAIFTIPGGNTPQTQAEAAALRARVQVCDDLYGEARGLPADRLTRNDVAPAQIPRDVALELAHLDDNEVSTALTTADDQSLMFLMLCKRTPATAQPIDRDTVKNQLIGQQLAGFSDQMVAQLRAAAVITGE